MDTALPIAPQGGLPSVSIALSYSTGDRVEYTWANLNGRLIDRGKLVAGFEDIPFTTTGVKQFDCMALVDLLAQPIHVDLNRV